MSIKGFQFEGDETIHKYDYESLDNKLQFDDTLTQTGKIPDSKKVGDAIADIQEDLADMSTDGIVPTSRQLLSDKYAVDEEPYKYRASYSGDRMDDEIVGGSIVWNQRVQAGTTGWTNTGVTSAISENEVTITSSFSSTSVKWRSTSSLTVSHVYIASCDVKTDGTTEAVLGFYFINGSAIQPNVYTTATAYEHKTTIAKIENATDICALRLRNSTESGGYATFKNVMLFDLTAMFGTTVANAVYAMEQAEAGAGVAYFRKLFPNDYYEYDAGTLKHVEGVSSHDTVGFNLFDADTVLPNINVQKQSDGSWYIPIASSVVGKIVWENTLGYQGQICVTYEYKYNSSSNVGARFVTRYTNGTNTQHYIDATTEYRKNTFTTTLGKTVKHIEFTYGTGSVATNLRDICVNLSDPSRNGTYEPYVKHSYSLDSSLTLRGIPKLGDNGLYFDGDRYKADGTVERRYGVVDLGTLNWLLSGGRFSADVSGLSQKTARTVSMICSKYVALCNGEAYPSEGDTVIYGGSGGVYVHDNTYADATAFKSAMSGVYLVYELATPTTETATQYTALQTVDARGTEEYVSTSIVPVGHYTKYYDDLRKKLDGLPWNLDMIAPIETSTTASQAYAVGKYFLLNYQLCKAKTAIASGATFTLNTNYEVTTVADELYTALHA